MDEYYSQILKQFLGKERTGSAELIDETTRQSALIAATSQRTSRAAQSAEPISRKERARCNGTVRPLEEAALIAFAKQIRAEDGEKLSQWLQLNDGEIISLMANLHYIQPPQCPLANAQEAIEGDPAVKKGG